MTRKVETRRPSFPAAPVDRLLDVREGERWQVVCGDENHWRAGIYSPPETSVEDIAELESHDCPELFVLLKGRLVLVLDGESGRRAVELEPMRPILVTDAHGGYCPDGPHTGMALVVERDAFVTWYRPV